MFTLIIYTLLCMFTAEGMQEHNFNENLPATNTQELEHTIEKGETAKLKYLIKTIKKDSPDNQKSYLSNLNERIIQKEINANNQLMNSDGYNGIDKAAGILFTKTSVQVIATFICLTVGPILSYNSGDFFGCNNTVGAFMTTAGSTMGLNVLGDLAALWQLRHATAVSNSNYQLSRLKKIKNNICPKKDSGNNYLTFATTPILPLQEDEYDPELQSMVDEIKRHQDRSSSDEELTKPIDIEWQKRKS